MKKLVVVFMTLCLVALGANAAIACDGPECSGYGDVNVSGDVYSPELYDYRVGPNGDEDAALMTGIVGMRWDITARGTTMDQPNVAAFGINRNGGLAVFDDRAYHKIKSFGGAFQKEVRQGELSGAYGLTVSCFKMEGYAKGIDDPDNNTGADYANVDLTAHGVIMQENAAFSDDRDSFAYGGNFSGVEYEFHTDNRDYGVNDQYNGMMVTTGNIWWNGKHWPNSNFIINGLNDPAPDGYKWFGPHRTYQVVRIPDLDAEAYDRLSGGAMTIGGTLVYARQVDNFALAAGITANVGGAMSYNAEDRYVNTFGDGYVGGVAQLPGVGVSSFNANFNYDCTSPVIGVAGGISTVRTHQTGNSVGVSARGFAFSKVKPIGIDR